MVSRYSLALVFATVFACMVFGARLAAADGPTIQITAPQNGATVSGDTFELSWTSDPAVVGTAVAIMADGHEIMSYFQNAAENHLTLPVPPVKAGKYCVISIMSYWQAIRSGSYFTSPYVGQVGVTFGNSVSFLEPTVADGQSGDTFTINWKGHPERTGTALRLELWQTGRKLQDLGYVWDYTTVNGSWTGPMPRVKRSDGYLVRIVSLYQESHAPYWDLIWGESDAFTLNALPYVQVLSPSSTGTDWGYGTHHILWACDPAYFGTAARIELWRNHRFYMLLGYKWDCAQENDFEIPVPAAMENGTERSNEYKVRVISLWQEAHPQAGVPEDDFSSVFRIVSQTTDHLVYPYRLANWVADENGKYLLSYNSTPSVVGSAVRIDLWKGNKFFKTLGYNWNNQTTNSLLLDPLKVSDARDYFVRVVSLWLEQHPTPMVATYIENELPISISSAPPMYFRETQIYDNNWGWDQQLSVSWHTDWQVVGMNFRIELWPRHPQTPNEHYLIANSQANTEEFYGESFPIPPMPTDETQYYVRISSYWQEQIQGPYQYIETPWLVTVPYPRQ
jgi:hypothetical protein